MILLGKFSNPRDEQPIRIPPDAKTGKATIGAQKAAASDKAARKLSALAKNRKIILISICSVAAVLLIGIIVSIWYFVGWPTDDGLILNNVMVSGINLGGMTREQAEEALHRATDHTFTQTDMVVELPDTTLSFSPSRTGAKLDVEAVVDEAYNYGRVGNLKEREAAKEASLTTTHHIPLLNYLNLDLSYIRSELDAYGESFNSTYVPSSVEFDIDAPILDASDEKFRADAPCQVMTLTVGMPGRHLDIDDVYNKVLDAYSFNTFLVTVGLSEAETLPEALDLESLYKECRKDPVNAYLDMETFEVVPEIYGYDFNLEQALQQLEQAHYGDTLEVPFRYLLPEVLGDDLSEKLFRDVLGAYETKHSGDENRNNNLRLACATINGLILAPGDVFDFNTVVGERTAAAGYKAADAYDGGQTVKTLGGGICQVSSTLYYCTLVADLQIVKRSPHSYVSSYMPMGMDATVSWGGPDFSFKNSTNFPIRIEAKVEGGYVKIQLIGTDEKDYYIVMTNEILGSQSPDTIYKEYSPGNAEGYRDGQVLTTPYTGYTVKTYKNKYDKETNQLIEREEDRISVYRKRDKVVVKIVLPEEPAVPEEPIVPDDPGGSGEGSGSGSGNGEGSGSGSGNGEGSGSGSGSGEGSGGGGEGSGGSGESE